MQVAPCLCLNWESPNPSPDQNSLSPYFTIENIHFQMKLCNNKIYSLHIYKADNLYYGLKQNVIVQVDLKNREGRLTTYSQYNRNIDITRCCIWKSSNLNEGLDILLESKLSFFVFIVENAGASASILNLMESKFCLGSLSEDFSKLLDEGSDTDVEFQCGEYTAKAHKNLLCTRSPVFASMLKSDMVESKTGLVKIQDMTADILEKFLRYLYTGRLDKLTVDTAKGLYEAGDKYAVKRLTRRCADFLAENLTDDNALEALVLSHAHSDKAFTDAVIKYILAKKFPLKDQWPTFCETHPKIAIEVLNVSYNLQN